ncbi:DUF3352 domain-containing protein [Synechocystis sp. PCC 7509]|uniref:DUF3352 domain-containing protein n=1 Tax=Synechocystis sp. PCC 7509 TaxID=927677 RepID=UPI0002ABA11C|nr:DUF3352 domain-containing protein [Synechocystis sp. PCC 7509]
MSAQKSNFLFPALATAVVVASGIAAYVYFRGGLGDGASPLASAKIVPDEALMASFISPDSKAWEQLQKFGTPEAKNLINKSLQDANKQALAESNIDYEKDLKPWVGGVMIAVLPPNSTKPTQTKAESFNVLMVVKIKDKVNALNFANKLKERKNVKNTETEYKGQKITESIEGSSAPVYSSILNNEYVVVAPEKIGVQKAIDTFKGEPSFATKKGANSLLAKGIDLTNPIAQVYLPDYGAVVEQLIASSPNASQISPETLAQLKQIKSVIAGVGVDNDGMRLKVLADVDSQLLKNQYQASSGKLVNILPAETIALITGAGISKSWLAFSKQAKDIPQVSLGLDLARVQLQNYNLDLDKDIFGWMDGEFAIAAIASKQGLLAPIGFGGALLIDTTNRPTAEATLTKLDGIAKTSFIGIAPRNIGATAVTEWTVPGQGALLGHGWLDKDTVFIAFGGPIADVVATKPSQLLTTSDSFKAATSSLPKSNAGYFYLDMDKTVALINANAQAGAITPEAKAILDSIRGIGMSASSPNNSTSQFELLLALKPSSK